MNMAAVERYFEQKTRLSAMGDRPEILSEIYREQCHLAVWQRSHLPDCNAWQPRLADWLATQTPRKVALKVTSDNSAALLADFFSGCAVSDEVRADIAQLVDMFGFLFELKEVGLRLTLLQGAMCPRFHVDQVPCRLISTYHGAGTMWLPHHLVDRSKLGLGNQGLPDEQSGIYHSLNDIRQLQAGDVALLKGERWQGNELAGVVHRSPPVNATQMRLLLTLDWLS